MNDTTKQQLDAIDEALGIAPPGSSGGGVMAQHFRDAGFTDDEAVRGAAMMESGHYFGFVDVATSLRPSGVAGKHPMSPVMESAVQRVAKIADARPTKNAWGRSLSESADTTPKTPWGRVREDNPPTSTGPEEVYFLDGKRITLAEATALGAGTAERVETFRKVAG